jgi:hypothetical protein
MSHQTRPRAWTRLGMASLAALAAFTLVGTSASAQQPGTWGKARDACNAAASRAGYVILRRDRESLNGTVYSFPWRVRRGSDEVDMTCHFDASHASVDLPGFERSGTAAGRLETQDQRAQRRCEDFVNSAPGYRVLTVEPATRHGTLWDVSMTVRHHGRDGVPITCRFNPASNRLTIKR